MIEIIHPGPLCTVQDHGRPGWAHLGVGHSGAADRDAHDLANRLVGNDSEAATLECTFGGLRVRFHTACYVAVAGAECTLHTSVGLHTGHQRPMALPAGAELTLGTPQTGLRTYLAVRGGVDAPSVLGSRSTDLLSGLGHRPLAAGDRLGLGAAPGSGVPAHFAPPRAARAEAITLWPGPRWDWFDSGSRRALERTPYTVLPTSNRIGARLSGQRLGRVIGHELPSEGIVHGSVQVPNDGQPLIFLADHPVTGGYPVIAVVDPVDLARVAQARPGSVLRFRWQRQAVGDLPHEMW